MAETKFDQHNADFSDAAHAAALEQIYPDFFKTPFKCQSTSLYKDKKNRQLDGFKKIDRLFHFDSGHEGRTITITVQERFRRIWYSDNREVTIGEINYASGMSSEMHGIEAMYFVYGYFDDKTNQFRESIIVNIPDLLRLVVLGKIQPIRRFHKRKQQSFLAFKFDDLIANGCASYWSFC